MLQKLQGMTAAARAMMREGVVMVMVGGRVGVVTGE